VANNALSWRAFLNAKRETGARKVLARMAERLDCPIESPTIEPYWKIRGMHVADFSTPAPPGNVADALLHALLLAQALGADCHVSGPHLYQDGSGNAELQLGGGPHPRFRVFGAHLVIVHCSGHRG
jgi:hypothetical protein